MIVSSRRRTRDGQSLFRFLSVVFSAVATAASCGGAEVEVFESVCGDGIDNHQFVIREPTAALVEAWYCREDIGLCTQIAAAIGEADGIVSVEWLCFGDDQRVELRIIR